MRQRLHSFPLGCHHAALCREILVGESMNTLRIKRILGYKSFWVETKEGVRLGSIQKAGRYWMLFLNATQWSRPRLCAHHLKQIVKFMDSLEKGNVDAKHGAQRERKG
jgi:hypothetical protein